MLIKERREKRGRRPVIRHRADRVRQVRRLIRKHILRDFPIESQDARESYQRTEKSIRSDRQAGQLPFCDLPWHLRVEGLERKLTAEEAAIALMHLDKHPRRLKDHLPPKGRVRALQVTDRQSAHEDPHWRCLGIREIGPRTVGFALTGSSIIHSKSKS